MGHKLVDGSILPLISDTQCRGEASVSASESKRCLHGGGLNRVYAVSPAGSLFGCTGESNASETCLMTNADAVYDAPKI